MIAQCLAKLWQVDNIDDAVNRKVAVCVWESSAAVCVREERWVGREGWRV